MDADVNGWMHNEGHGFGWIEVNVDGWMEIWMGGCRWGWINVDVDGWMDADVDGWIQLQIDGSRCKWMVAYMCQKLQDRKKVLQMSQLDPHSESHPAQTFVLSNF